MKMNDRCDEALREIFHMSYVWDHSPMTNSDERDDT